jgi:hypothetical protein
MPNIEGLSYEPPPKGYESWRAYFRPYIAELVEMIRTCDMDDAQARREFRHAWKWGPRRYWPYKVWRDEIARQMGWLSGRLPGPGYDEVRRQRSLEELGQIRMFA